MDGHVTTQRGENASKLGSRDSLTVGLLTNACTSSETSVAAETISQKHECRWCLSPPKMLKKYTFNYNLN